MESRGYGRAVQVAPRAPADRPAALALGRAARRLRGLYGLLDASAPAAARPAAARWSARVLAGAGLLVGARREPRSRYRRDPWALPEWLVVACGAAAGGRDLVVAPRRGAGAGIVPTQRPAGAALPVPAVLVGLLPACRRRRRPRPAVTSPSASRRRWPRDQLRARVACTYAGAAAPVLRDVDLDGPRGRARAWSSGRTGSGKSTLLRTVNGLVPHFTGGTLTGRVTVDGRDTAHAPPARPRRRRRPRRAGPARRRSSPTSSRTSSPTAWSRWACAPTRCAAGSRRPSTCSASPTLRDRPLRTLSGGQQQRVAIGAVLAAAPAGARARRADLGAGPRGGRGGPGRAAAPGARPRRHGLLAEHRLERVVQYADRVRPRRRRAHVSELLDPAEAMLPLPDLPARRRRSAASRAGRRCPCRSATPAARRPTLRERARRQHARARAADLRVDRAGRRRRRPASGSSRGGRIGAATASTSTVRPGEVGDALMGRNGAGKSTLLGASRRSTGSSAGACASAAAGVDPHPRAARERVRTVGLVPQEPELLLYADTVAAECAAADARLRGRARHGPRAARPHLPRRSTPHLHPRDLSEGQRLALALAVILAGRPPLLLLDEPTRGLDYARQGAARRDRSREPRRRRARGRAGHPRRRAGGRGRRPGRHPRRRRGRHRRARPRGARRRPRPSRRRWPRCSLPQPWLTVAEVARRWSRRREPSAP